MPPAILITGAAGFIGFHLAQRLLKEGATVLAIDSLNSYYDPALKRARLELLRQSPRFHFHQIDLADRDATRRLFREETFGPVIHLAAQAGVRHSLIDPHAYVDANLAGFANVLEGCRQRQTPHLIFASSSSVYGANTRLPYSTRDNVDHPVSFYAATKKANEQMAHSYSHLFGIPATGLRFFTAYGTWYRPDMALFIFARAILRGEPIRLFNDGKMRRDFTYIDDAVDDVVALIDRPAQPNPAWSASAPDPASSNAPWRIYNVGNGRPIAITRIVDVLEQELGRKAVRELAPIQPGDVIETCADIDDLTGAIGVRPRTTIEDGIKIFAAWFRDYHESASVPPAPAVTT
jgi:UDP-glucuronate 4-epimerase